MLRGYTKFLSNSIWQIFTNSALAMKKSAKNHNHRFRRFGEQLLTET